MKQHYQRLPLEGAFNVRELGGLPASGGQTAYFQFLRSDNLAFLTEKDIAFLKNFGLAAVIDLRSHDETAVHQNPFEKDPQVAYYNIPFSPGAIGDATRAENIQSDDFLADFYLFLLEQGKDRVKQLFDTISQHQKGTVLFHCTAGKDRTGVLAMLLLGLAGVARYDIGSNYQVSYTYLRETLFFERLKGQAVPQLLWSKEEFIYKAYDHLMDAYGGIKAYLAHCGVDEATLQKVREKLLGA